MVYAFVDAAAKHFRGVEQNKIAFLNVEIVAVNSDVAAALDEIINQKFIDVVQVPGCGIFCGNAEGMIELKAAI